MKSALFFLFTCLLSSTISGDSTHLPFTNAPITQSLWAEVEDTYQDICDHPFIREAVDGTLPQEVFEFYQVQDHLYLVEFARCFARAATQTPNLRHANILMHIGASRMQYLSACGYLDSGSATPATLAYTDFLRLSTHQGSSTFSLTALLPCMVVYSKLFQDLLSSVATGNPYASWISKYASFEYQQKVQEVVDLFEEEAKNASPEDLEQMKRIFSRGVWLEWLFWDSAYRQEQRRW